MHARCMQARAQGRSAAKERERLERQVEGRDARLAVLVAEKQVAAEAAESAMAKACALPDLATCLIWQPALSPSSAFPIQHALAACSTARMLGAWEKAVRAKASTVHLHADHGTFL